MPVAWQDVEASPEYAALPTAEKRTAQREYFASVVATRIPDEASRNKAWGEFTKQYPITADGSTGNKYQEQYLASLSVPQKFMIGAGAGLVGVGKGLQQLFMREGPEKQKMEAQYEADRASYGQLRERSTAAKVGQFVGENAPYAVVPAGASLRLPSQMALGALTGAAIGGSQYVPPDGSRATNAVVGGTLGALMPPVIAGGSKVVNAALGKVPKNALEVQAERAGVRLTRGEATGNVGAQKTETLLERLPGWLGGIREWRGKQRQEAADAARAFISKYTADPLADTTVGMKAANEAHIDTLYDSLRSVAQQTLKKVEAPETKAAVQELRGRFPAVFESLQDTRLKSILADIAGDVEDKTVVSSVLGPNGQPIVHKVTPTFSYNDLVEARKGISKVITKAMAAKDDTAASILLRAKEGIDADLQSLFAQGGGQAGALFREANETFVREKVKFDALRTVYDKVMGTTSAKEGFSPKTFSTYLKQMANDPKMGKKYHWTPAEVEEMTGLANVMQAVKRAGQYAENPPTGNRWGPAVAVAEASTSPVKLAGGAVLGWVARFLTTTRAGKTLSRAASKIEPGTPAMAALLRHIESQAQKMATVEATKPADEVPQ